MFCGRCAVAATWAAAAAAEEGCAAAQGTKRRGAAGNAQHADAAAQRSRPGHQALPGALHQRQAPPQRLRLQRHDHAPHVRLCRAQIRRARAGDTSYTSSCVSDLDPVFECLLYV